MNYNPNGFNYAGVPTLVTPAQAELWLSKNAEFQRGISTKKVDHWVSIMRRGQWKLTHQGVAITKSGEILDGQHRLKAITIYGRPLMLVVTLNADPSTFDVLDRGYLRSSVQILHMSGRHLSSYQIASLHTLLWTSTSLGSVDRKWNTEDLPKVCDYFMDALSVVYAKGNQNRFVGGYVRGAGLKAILSDSKNTEKVARFFEVLSSGLPEKSSENAALQLAQRLDSITKGKGSREVRYRSYWMTCHALKLFFAGSVLKHAGNLGNEKFLATASSVFPTFIDGAKSYESWDSIYKRSGKQLLIQVT